MRACQILSFEGICHLEKNILWSPIILASIQRTLSEFLDSISLHLRPNQTKDFSVLFTLLCFLGDVSMVHTQLISRT